MATVVTNTGTEPTAVYVGNTPIYKHPDNIYVHTTGTGSYTISVESASTLTFTVSGGCGGAYFPTLDTYAWWALRNSDAIEYIERIPAIKCFSLSGKFMGLSNVKYIPVYQLDTEGTTSMDSMFSGCKSIIQLDIDDFDTSKVTNMGSMFDNCQSLGYLNLSNFDTSKVTNMQEMFRNVQCDIDISNFDLQNVTSMINMFSVTDEVTKVPCNITLPNGFEPAGPADCRYMFYGRHFKDPDFIFTLSVIATNIDSMFRFTNSTWLYIISLDTSKATSMEYMFANSSSLESVDCDMDLSSMTNANLAFAACPKLTDINGLYNINVDISFYSSPLVNTCAEQIIMALKNLKNSSGIMVYPPRTITFSSTTYNTLSSTQLALATSKGWTVAKG